MLLSDANIRQTFVFTDNNYFTFKRRILHKQHCLLVTPLFVDIMVNIAVIGAGVVGLSTAVNIQRVLPGVKVKVVADRFYDETTSIGAGGLFIPTTETVPGVPYDTLKRWGKTSWRVYSQLATSDLASTTGHRVSHGYKFCETAEERALYAEIVFSYRKMMPDELHRLGVNSKYRFGYEITTIITNMRTYLSWLMKQFTGNGGQVEKRKVEHFSELYGHCDVVVNCSGLGSQKLCGDQLVHPVRGQFIRVEAPWVADFVISDTNTHILPSDDFTVLGGIWDRDNYSMVPDPSVKQGILDRCLDLWPAIKGARITGDWVGLRPTRAPIRLDKEIRRVPGGVLKIVHNYGHGTNGVALSWGTAVEATEMVKELLSGTTSSKL